MPPRFLYKFRSFIASDPESVDRVRDVIVRSRLWLSSASDFNDPFDMSASVTIPSDPVAVRAILDGIFKQTNIKYPERQKLISNVMKGGKSAAD